MIFKRAALFLGLLAFASPAWAGSGMPDTSRDVGTKAGAGGQQEVTVTDLAPRLKPRPIPTDRLRVPEFATGRLIIKFNDELRMRKLNERAVRSLRGGEVDPVNEILQQFDLVLQPMFNASADERIERVLRRAEEHSGRKQPDLAGMMYIDGAPGVLLNAARALNDLPQVEWIEFDEERFLGAAPSDPMAGATGACCIPGSCVVVTAAGCTILGGNYQGDGTDCTGGCGACCLGDGTCVITTNGGCVGIGGIWSGSGVPCPLGGCGGCCLPGPSQICVNTTPAACAAEGGVFQGGGVMCGASFLCGACCIPSGDPEIPAACELALGPACTQTLGGIYTSDGTPCSAVDCDDLTDTGCGSPGSGGCFQPGGNGTPLCDDQDCCDLVCDIFDPFCCEDFGEWDQTCVYTAHLVCATPPMGGADRCASIFNDSCFEPHGTGGCSDQACCNLVCAVEDGCCDNEWDGFCVVLALQICAAPADPEDPTPDFEPLQGHLARAPLDPMAFTGYNGVGLHLRVPGDPFDDLNGNNWWDPGEPFVDVDGTGFWTPPSGLYGLAEELLHVYGVDETGLGNLTRGKSIRIAVIEWSFYEGHEDLDVWVEPGQTLIVIPEVGEPDHGTASLGVAGAREDGTGVTGVAPEANLMFFPLTSVEEGPRESAAWLAALDVLRAGDVISCSYGPAVNLNNTLATWTFIRLAADLGITACIAAGNGCLNLDNAPDLGDSGGIVVGATSPGSPHYRLAFSNFYVEPDPLWERSNVVHVNAWGSNVVTTGYGDLFIPSGPPGADFNRLRSYTAFYGGTSAAAPQVAGVVAVLQGFAKQFYGIPLATDRLRATIAADVPAPTLRGGPAGFEEGSGCSLDLDPDQGPHRVGGYPLLAGSFGSAASSILNQSFLGFDDSPLLENILVLKGQWLFGNRFSVKGFDGNYLVVESRFVNRGKPANNPGLGGDPPRGGVNLDDVPEAKSVTYLGSGQVTDVIAIGKSDLENPTTLGVQVFFGQIDVFQIGFIEAFNWTTGTWQFLGLGLLNPGPEGAIDGGALNAGNYIRDDDGRMLVRVWNLGFAIDSPLLGPGKFRTRIDLIGIDVETAFGNP